jgi:hypothetical protein
MFGAAALAHMSGKSPVSIRQSVRRGTLIPDALLVRPDGGREYLWTSETVEALRTLASSTIQIPEPICQ